MSNKHLNKKMELQKNFIFNEGYTPENILFREEQQQKISLTFNNFFGNLLLIGRSGTGKTTTINYIMKKYAGRYLFTTASDKVSSLAVLRGLLYNPYKTTYVFLEKFVLDLMSNPRILIIDEINKIHNMPDFFGMLNHVYRKVGTPIILITNKETILKNMPEDARLTLFLKRTYFSAYNALELKEIINSRLKLLEGIEVPESAVNYISAICTKDGSARKAIYMVSRCILAEKYDSDFVDNIEREVVKEDWERWINSLSNNENKFLSTLVDIYTTCSENNGEIKISEIQKHLPNHSPSRISQLVSEFESAGIIDTKYVNRGRAGGRYRIISFSNHEIFNKLESII